MQLFFSWSLDTSMSNLGLHSKKKKDLTKVKIKEVIDGWDIFPLGIHVFQGTFCFWNLSLSHNNHSSIIATKLLDIYA